MLLHADAGPSLRLPLLPLLPVRFSLENVDRSWSFGPILEIAFWTSPKSGGVCKSQNEVKRFSLFGANRADVGGVDDRILKERKTSWRPL